MLTTLWDVICRLGAWRSHVYMLAPSEWEAGKCAEVTLHQLGFDAEVIEVLPQPDLDPRPLIQSSSLPESSCMMCGQYLDYEEWAIERESIVEQKSFPFYGTMVKMVGELRKIVCPSCGCPETWKMYFGFMPVNWFKEKNGRIIPFVGKTLLNHKEAINP